MDRKDKILIIIPALNEAGKISVVISRIKKEASESIDEILVVNDGSVDSTSREAKDKGATVISHDSNKGVGATMRTGIEYALKNRYDIVVMIGADNQDSPEEIKRLLHPILYDHFDFVQGSRYMAGGGKVNMPLFRFVTTLMYSFLLKIITGFPVSDGTNGFRAFRLNILKDNRINLWQAWLDRYELEPYLFYKVIEYNFRVKEMPVTKYYPREKIGYTKMVPIVSWWSILRPLILLKLGIKK